MQATSIHGEITFIIVTRLASDQSKEGGKVFEFYFFGALEKKYLVKFSKSTSPARNIFLATFYSADIFHESTSCAKTTGSLRAETSKQK